MNAYKFEDLSERGKQASWLKYLEDVRLNGIRCDLPKPWHVQGIAQYDIKQYRDNLMPKLGWTFTEHGERIA